MKIQKGCILRPSLLIPGQYSVVTKWKQLDGCIEAVEQFDITEDFRGCINEEFVRRGLKAVRKEVVDCLDDMPDDPTPEQIKRLLEEWDKPMSPK